MISFINGGTNIIGALAKAEEKSQKYSLTTNRKETKMAEKLYRINTNINLETVHKPLLIDKSKQLEGGGFGEMTASAFFSNIVLQAINQAHPTGNMASLRRTKSLSEKLAESVKGDGLITLGEEDYKYIQSAFNKADKWNNSLEIANSVILIMDTITNAEVIE